MRPSASAVNLLGEQPLATDVRQAAILHDVAGGADGVLLEHVHAPQHRAEGGELLQKGARLHQSQR
jgi:hypothetical protein